MIRKEENEVTPICPLYPPFNDHCGHMSLGVTNTFRAPPNMTACRVVALPQELCGVFGSPLDRGSPGCPGHGNQPSSSAQVLFLNPPQLSTDVFDTCALLTTLGLQVNRYCCHPDTRWLRPLSPVSACLRTSYKYIPTSRAEKSLGTFYKWPSCSIFGHTGREKHVGACRNYFGPPLNKQITVSSPLTSYMISV